jgi:hypothetical protein
VAFPCGLAANQDAGAQNGKNGAKAAILSKRRRPAKRNDIAAEKTFTVEGIRIPDTRDSDERHIRSMPHKGYNIHELSERS